MEAVGIRLQMGPFPVRIYILPRYEFIFNQVLWKQWEFGFKWGLFPCVYRHGSSWLFFGLHTALLGHLGSCWSCRFIFDWLVNLSSIDFILIGKFHAGILRFDWKHHAELGWVWLGSIKGTNQFLFIYVVYTLLWPKGNTSVDLSSIKFYGSSGNSASNGAFSRAYTRSSSSCLMV